MSRALIIGGGLAAATCSHELRKNGYQVTVLEKDEQWGGLVRTAEMNGIIYEPNGSHIFHTDDEEVWDLANEATPFWNYEHRVQTMIEGQLVRWPIMMEDVQKLSFGEKFLEHLDAKSPMGSPDEMNFEDWCVSLMGEDAYNHFIKPYTEKQWGMSATDLSASFAPKRVQVRTDGDDRLFKDKFQGFPDGAVGASYADMLDYLMGNAKVLTGKKVDINMIARILDSKHKPDIVIITVPLDDLCHNVLGELHWRGLTFTAQYVPDVDYVQSRMCVNWPSKDFPWIRTHETKHASRQGSRDEITGSVLVTEFTGGPGRYYPVPGKDGADRRLNERYQEWIKNFLDYEGTQIAFIGRLSTFQYLDMDDVMRSALDGVREMLKENEHC